MTTVAQAWARKDASVRLHPDNPRALVVDEGRYMIYAHGRQSVSMGLIRSGRRWMRTYRDAGVVVAEVFGQREVEQAIAKYRQGAHSWQQA